MRYFILVLSILMFTTFTVNAQITPASFTTPVNTGANMTVGMNATKFDQFEGGTIGAFYDLNGDGALQCVGSEAILTGFFGLAIWGDDSSTPEIDGLSSGESPVFAILYNDNVILVSEVPQFTGYVTNGMANITDANLSSAVAGCTDDNACNVMIMYSDVSYTDDNSCIYPQMNCDCDGNCLNNLMQINPFDYSLPVNTGRNMTVGFLPSSGLENFYGKIGAFTDINGDGVLQCVGLSTIQNNGFTGIGLWGDDTYTNQIDGLSDGEKVVFMIIHDSFYVPIHTSPEFNGYTSNSVYIIEEIHFDYYGCTDDRYCNYQSEAFQDWGQSVCEGLAQCNDSNFIEYVADRDCDDSTLCKTTLIQHMSNLEDSVTFYSNAMRALQNNQIFTHINEGWNILGYTNDVEKNTIEALSDIQDILIVIKDNNANFYMPEYDFNGIGNLIPGQGYQMKTTSSYNQFTFDDFINIPGCVFEWAENYNSIANLNDGSCFLSGCNLYWADNYDPNATIDDGTCFRIGCMEWWADNYDHLVTIQDHSCYRYGCTDPWAINYDPYATIDDYWSCNYYNCWDPWSQISYNPIWPCDYYYNYNDEDGYLEYNNTTDFSYDSSDDTNIVYGCTNPSAINYDPYANTYDGSCIDKTSGCTDSSAYNYNAEANTDDGTCIYVNFILGCTDSNSDNYNPNANTDDGSCQ